MGECVEKLPCPECVSSDALQVFEAEDGTFNGFCYACDTYHPHPYSNTVPKEEVIPISKVDPTEYPILPIVTRGIKEGVCKAFDVRCAVDESDGVTITESYYPDTKDGVVTGWEVRNHKDKSFYGIGDRKGSVELWGTSLAKKNNGRNLFVTEGRLDAMSLYQCLVEQQGKKYSSSRPSVVSLTRGAAGALKDLLNNREFVESFSDVVLCLDNDDAGKRAVKDIIKTFPLFKVATLPLKDANEMLLAKRDKELFNQVMWNSEVRRQGEIVDIEDFLETALLKPKMGVETPWPNVTKLIYGFRPHTVHIVGAAPKIGKSDHEYQIIHHLAYRLGIKVGVFDLENPPAKTSKKIASKEVGVDFTKPDSVYDVSTLRKSLLSMQGLVRFYDRGASRDWEDIRASIEEMHQLDGINFFVIDPLTSIVSRFSSSEANDRLNEICTDMADLVYKFPITLINYSHVNPKQKGSKAHEDGARVLSSEFTGSRAMEKWFHYGWGIRRNRSPDCPIEEQDISHLDLLFDRDFGNSGTTKLFFNKSNMRYLEV